MVDIHSHVLYGLDDGARTLEESVTLVAMAAEAGTTDLVATPHASPAYRFDPVLIGERLKEVREVVNGAVTLHTGCDFHLSYDNIEDALANPRKYTVNQNRYLLVEFSDLMIFQNTADIFRRLACAGMTPIITHPERNALLRQRIDQIAQWVEQGAYVQVTGQSLLGDFGKGAREFSETLLKRCLVHFLASDGHNAKYRPPVMKGAFEWVERKHSRALAELLCIKNPSAVLTGDPVETPEPPAGASSGKWRRFWRGFSE